MRGSSHEMVENHCFEGIFEMGTGIFVGGLGGVSSSSCTWMNFVVSGLRCWIALCYEREAPDRWRHAGLSELNDFLVSEQKRWSVPPTALRRLGRLIQFAKAMRRNWHLGCPWATTIYIDSNKLPYSRNPDRLFGKPMVDRPISTKYVRFLEKYIELHRGRSVIIPWLERDWAWMTVFFRERPFLSVNVFFYVFAQKMSWNLVNFWFEHIHLIHSRVCRFTSLL